MISQDEIIAVLGESDVWAKTIGRNIN
jgi:hypothetical protein